jgi:hypothetical protein
MNLMSHIGLKPGSKIDKNEALSLILLTGILFFGTVRIRVFWAL